MRVRNLLQEDPCTPVERLDVLSEIILEDVITEDDRKVIGPGPPPGETECLGDPSGPLLDLVGDADAKLRPRAEQLEEVPHVSPAGDDHDLLDTSVDQLLQGVADHRFVIYWQQVLVRHLRQRVQAGTGTPG